jgi:hypothetical protein
MYRTISAPTARSSARSSTSAGRSTRVEQVGGDRPPPVPGQGAEHGPGRAQRRTTQALHDQQARGAQPRPGDRYVDSVRLHRRRRGEVLQFDPEVQLLAERVREALGEVAQAERRAPAGADLERTGEAVQDVQVALGHLADAGALHLDLDRPFASLE